MTSKAGMPSAPHKRGWDGDDGDNKAPRHDLGSKAPALATNAKFGGKDGGKGDKAPTSKAGAAKWGGGDDQGYGKGKVVKGGYDGKGDGKGYGGKDGGFDGGKGGGYDGGKDGGYDGKGKGGYDGGKGGYDAGGKGGKDGVKGDKDGKGGKGMSKGQDYGNKENDYGSNEAPINTDPNLSPEDRKQALQKDILQPEQAKNGIEAFKSNGVEIELSMLAKKLTPSDEARRNSDRCLALVRNAVSQHFGQNGNVPSVELCGSYAQGNQVLGSAMDISFRIPSSFSVGDKDNAVSELRNRLQQQTNFVEVFVTQEVYPHASSPMAIDLKGSTPGLVAHVIVEEQRVDRPPSLDEAIKRLCDCCEAAHDLVRLVKIWSVNHGLANHQDGFLNGVTWTLLVVFFLQKSKLIPPYSYVSQGNQVTPTSAGMPLSRLLQNFFDFLQSRPQNPPGISVWQGEEFQGPPTPFIEDPAYFHEQRQSRSLNQSLGEQQWTRIMDESKKAFNRIKVRPGRWFHWAEVFDPTDRKPSKIHGLAQHLAEPLPNDFGKGGPVHADNAKGGSKGCNDGKGMDGKGMDGKGMDAKGMDGKGAPWSGKDGDAKGAGKDSDKGKGAPHGDGKGWSGKDSDGKGKGKDSDGKGGKESGKDDNKGWSGKDSGKGGKDYGKDHGKDSDKGYGKDSGDKGWSSKDSGDKGYGKGGKKGYKPY